MANEFDVMLRFLLNKSSLSDSKKGIQELITEIGKIEGGGKGTATATGFSGKQTQDQANWGKVVTQTTKAVVEEVKVVKELNAEFETGADALRAMGVVSDGKGGWKEQTNSVVANTKAIVENNNEIKKRVELSRNGVPLSQIQKDAFGLTADPKKTTGFILPEMTDEERRVVQERAAASESLVAQNQKILASNQKAAVSFQQLSRAGRLAADAVNIVANAMVLTGAAITGSIVKAATDYIKNAKESNLVVLEWKSSVDSLKKSYEEIGEIAAATILPVLKAAAETAKLVTQIIKANPGVLGAGLAVGATLLTVGTLGKAVASGIRLVADLTYVAATATQALAGGEMLTAAGLQVTAGGEMLAAAIAFAAPILAFVAAVGLVVGAVAGIYEFVARKGGGAMKGDAPYLSEIATGGAVVAGRTFGKIAGLDESEIERKAIVFAALIGRLTGAIDESSPLWIRAAESVKKASGILGSIAEDEEKGLEILKNLAEQEAEAKRRYADDIQGILIDSARDIEDANRSLASSLSGISENLIKSIDKINAALSDRLSDLADDFAEDNAKAEQEYQQRRSEIIADGAERIREIQEQAARDLEDLEREHNKNVNQLAAERDALGLVKENEAYEEKKAEIKRNAEESIEQARANTQAQLEEAARNYEQQRAQRLAEYEKQKAEAVKKAEEDRAEARAKAEEDKREAQKRYLEEKEEIARQQQEKMEDLRRRFDEEQRERVLAANASIAELGGALNAELELRRMYNDIILKELEARLKAEANLQTSAPTNTGKFAPTSLNTSAIESMIGSKLQTGSLTGIQGITIQQNLRFSGEIGVAERREIKKMIRESALIGIMEATGV